MISILIPNYNTSIYELVKTLHSEATNLNIAFEICVCDDDSTLYRTENNRIQQLSNCHFFQHENNKGRTFTRDFLANKATYETLLYLDADVIPTQANFIATYLNIFPNHKQIIVGGYNYQDDFHPSQRLRWTFGKQRESISAKTRNVTPYKYVFSGNFLISKNTYIQLSLPKENLYGMDLLFSKALYENQIEVIHINNTIDHLGLESNDVFLNKSIKAVELRYLYRNSLETPFEAKYQKIKAFKLHYLFYKTTQKLTPLFLANLCSKKPKMFVFDLYRLGYYCKLHLEEKESL